MALKNITSALGQIQKNISKIKIEKNIPAISPTSIIPPNIVGSNISTGQHTITGAASSFNGPGGLIGGGGGTTGGGGGGGAGGGGGGGAGGDADPGDGPK
jgi:hypothetical protein